MKGEIMFDTKLLMGVALGYLFRHQIEGLLGGMKKDEQKLKEDLGAIALKNYGALGYKSYGAVGLHGHKGLTGHPGQADLAPLGGYGAIHMNPGHYGAIHMNPRHM